MQHISLRSRIIHLLVVATLAMYVGGFEYLPFQDLPQWTYHGYVMHQWLAHHDDLGGHFRLQPYLPPNSAATLVIAALEGMLAPIVAGKIYLLITLVLCYSGSVRLMYVLGSRQEAVNILVAIGGCMTLDVQMGFVNFVFGLGVALHGSVYVLRHRSSALGFPLMLFLFAAYVSHFVAAAILCSVLLVVCMREANVKLFKRSLLALLPSVVLFVQYCIAKDIPMGPTDGFSVTYAESVRTSIRTLPAVVMPVHRMKHVFEPSTVFVWFDAVFAIGFWIGAVWMIVRSIRARYWEFSAVIGALALAIAIFSPAFLGGMVAPGVRFTYVGYLAIVAFIARTLRHPRSRRVLAFGLCTLTMVSATILVWSTAVWNRELDAAPIDTFGNYDTHGGSNPFTHFHFYQDIRNHTPRPVFRSGIITYVEDSRDMR
ncbi:MAG: hypothetical protein JSS75_03930 [Bacteroidetes bacterium]|nr:hypothetical protein [Bacteroidota bacterium]